MFLFKKKQFYFKTQFPPSKALRIASLICKLIIYWSLILTGMKYEHKWDSSREKSYKIYRSWKNITFYHKRLLGIWKFNQRFTSFLWLFNIHELSWTPIELVGRGCPGELYKAIHLTLMATKRSKEKKDIARKVEKLGSIRHWLELHWILIFVFFDKFSFAILFQKKKIFIVWHGGFGYADYSEEKRKMVVAMFFIFLVFVKKL